MTSKEALELVRILFFNINEKTLQEYNRTSKIYDKLDNYIAQQEKKEKLLELYKEFYETLNPTIEYDTTDEDDLPIDFEYLDISGATDRTLEIVKKIEELEDE